MERIKRGTGREKERERERERERPWAYAERFWGGFTKSSWGSGGRCEPPSGVRGGAPEDFEINAFQRLRTPVSLSFLSQCCYTKIHAIFFIHSHPHHFQLNEVVPNHTLWYQKANVKELPSFESCSSPAPWGLLVFWILETVPHCDPRPKDAVHSHIHMHSLPVRR